jgi:hydroxymethylglutaryl-CoA lyase
MAQVDELIERMNPRPGISYLALVLNDRGRERLEAHVPPLTAEDQPPALHTHLCPVFIKRNTNRTVEQARAGWGAVLERAVAEGKREAMIGVSSAWGSNWSGAFLLEQRLESLQEQHDAWEAAGLTVTDVLLADPMGWCMPHWVAEDLRAIKERWPAIRHFRIHLHNQRGMAVASTYTAITALDAEDTLYIDTTIGGIGGCPYCGNGRAAGMAPTEDVVQMLETMGLETGVDLYKLVDAAGLAEEIIGRPLDGHVSKAGPLPSGGRLFSEDLPVIETHEQAQHFRLGEEVTSGLRRPWMRG